MQNPEIPIACTLSPAQFDVRRSTLLAQLQQEIQQVIEKDDGFVYRFVSTDTLIECLASLIQLERQCCPFLRFVLTAEPGNGPVWLEVTGPEGTKTFLVSLWPNPVTKETQR